MIFVLFRIIGGAKIKNKILVLLYVPIIEQEYSVFIPIGKTIGTVKTVMIDIISDLVEQKFVYQMKLIDKQTNKIYNDTDIVKNSGIKNGTKLLLI